MLAHHITIGSIIDIASQNYQDIVVTYGAKGRLIILLPGSG